MACTDNELAPAEAERLAQHAKGLSISESRAAELKTFAQAFVIDSATAFAAAIGLDADTAERVEIRYRKRNGLV